MNEDKNQAQRALDQRLLGIAVQGGYLPQGSSLEHLTISVRQRMIDGYLLRAAISGGYLPESAGVKDLTDGVRQRMINDGKLPKYHPDGSISRD